MQGGQTLTQVLIAVIPSAVTAFCFWLIEHKIQKAEAKREKEEQRRREEAEKREKDIELFQIVLINSVNASLALGEATARAVERIPDTKCNGDMHSALEYATEVKHKQKEFLTERGIAALFEWQKDD